MIDVFDLDLTDEAQVIRHARETAWTGGDKSACPVAPADPMWAPWQQTWARSRSAMERESGAMAYRTQLMKAEVRRQTEHLDYLRPDPCADVMPDRPSLLGMVEVATSAFLDRFTAAMEDMATSITAAFEAVDWQGIVTQLSALAGEEEPPTKARLRHGSAATCPRHGETRGGTCMKCARSRR